MKYYIIAGEASGDLHGGNLLKELKNIDKQAIFRGWGGPRMEAQQCQIARDYRHTAFMGFGDIIKNIIKIYNNFKFCQEDILLFNPDVIILIDYPGFNLKIARWASLKKIKVIYYILPKIWAWNEARAKKLISYCNVLISILPFEPSYYKEKHNYIIDYVGNPLLDEIRSKSEINKKFNLKKPIIGLFPGSRKQELIKHFPIFLKIAAHYPQYDFMVAGVSMFPLELYRHYLKDNPEIKLVIDDSFSILQNADFAVLKSGTISLEAAILNVPQVVCYKTGGLFYFLAKKVVKIKYISLVNLILNRGVVPELIQHNCNETDLKNSIDKIINNQIVKNKMLEDYREIKLKLCPNDKSPSFLAAKKIFGYIKI